MKKYRMALLVLIAAITSCKDRGQQAVTPQEDLIAKRMLQGIWLNDDDQDVAFKAKGDTIFYPDSTSQPVFFQIFRDTLVLKGANEVKYPIVKQTPHLFVFRNHSGDEVKLKKSDEHDDNTLFSTNRPQALNQNELIKCDTVVRFDSENYHCYVQVNPTTYKVIKTSYNDEGVEVDNVYHDNIVNLNIYHGSRKLFSSDFRKQQFAKLVPETFISQTILSDLVYRKIDKDGIHYLAVLMIPDSMSSYEVELIVSYDGKLKMLLK